MLLSGAPAVFIHSFVHSLGQQPFPAGGMEGVKRCCCFHLETEAQPSRHLAKPWRIRKSVPYRGTKGAKSGGNHVSGEKVLMDLHKMR